MMPTVGDDLDLVQEKLHDDASLWTREELLEWYRDAYRQFIARSACLAQWTIIDVPGRVSYARAYEWEARHVDGGTSWKWTLATHDGYYHTAHTWEAQHTAAVTPTASVGGYTQPWERSYAEDGDRHFVFALPRNHERIKGIWWHHTRLEPVTVRELDDAEVRWMRLAGEPTRWTDGIGRNRMFEIYAIDTTYSQAYQLDFNSRGGPRSFGGSRTWAITHDAAHAWAYTTTGDVRPGPGIMSDVMGYGLRVTKLVQGTHYLFAWEGEMLEGETPSTAGEVVGTHAWEVDHGAADFSTVGVGTVRRVVSEDRQYWPIAETNTNTPYGIAVDWRSSDEALLVHEVIVPPTPDLIETDTPHLIPAPMQKYLRSYVLSRAFGRPGEGHRPPMATHYEQRFLRGVQLMKRLGDVAQQDRHYQREPYRAPSARRTPGVRFPSNFPAVV